MIKKFSIAPALKTGMVQKQNWEWYAKAKKDRLLPIKLADGRMYNCGLKDFNQAQHAQLFIDLLKISDYLLNCQNFEVRVEKNAISCSYRNKSGEGNFKINTDTELLSPEQKKQLIDLYDLMSIL